MPRSSGYLVTEADLAGYYATKASITAGSNNTLHMSGNQINTRYFLNGAPATERMPSWNELSNKNIVITCTFETRADGQYLVRNLNNPVNAILSFTGTIAYDTSTGGGTFSLTSAYNLPANVTYHELKVTSGLTNKLDDYTVTAISGNPYAVTTITNTNISNNYNPAGPTYVTVNWSFTNYSPAGSSHFLIDDDGASVASVHGTDSSSWNALIVSGSYIECYCQGSGGASSSDYRTIYVYDKNSTTYYYDTTLGTNQYFGFYADAAYSPFTVVMEYGQAV